MLTLMSHLSVATIKGSAPMPLRNYELEHDLFGLSQPGLLLQEAILDEQVLLCLIIGSRSLFVQHPVEGHFKCFMWCPKVLGNLIEDWVLLLLLLPVSDISCGQPCGSSHYCLFLGFLLAIQNGSDSLLGTLFKRGDSIVEYGLDPRVWNLVQVLLNFLLREAFIHPTQKVDRSVVLTLLVLQGEVVASESSYPLLPGSIQIGRGEGISERVVVVADYKLIPVPPIWGQIFMELLCNAPLKGQAFLFVGVVPLFSLIHYTAGIGDRMVSSICLLLR